MNFLKNSLAIGLCICISACSQPSVSPTQGTPHNKLPIQKIKIGMTQTEVKTILGSPHINPFSPNTWHYISRDNHKANKTVAITFKNAKVTEIH
tara:strand:- start:97 stop:378 length:282 start_codon:yes stop_codon:yes gene_type:complete